METSSFFAHFPALADAPNGVQKLRELILQLAVQGKLVPQEPTDEPATVLLAKIKAEKERLIQEKKIKKSEPLPPLKPNERPFEVPQSWEWVRAVEITSVITDGEHATPPRISQPGVPLVTAKNVRNGFLDLTTVDYVLEETAQKCWIRCDPKHDDILMVCVGATTGRLTLLKSPPRFTLVRSVALIRPMPEHVYPEFIALVINSPIGQSQVWSNVKQSAQPCLYINKIQGLFFPIPPLAEQRRIVAKVDQLMALCDELEARQQRQQTARVKLNNAALEGLLTARTPAEFAEHWQRICDNFDLLYDAPATVAALRQAILQLAVQGKLVPQDAHDEPFQNQQELISLQPIVDEEKFHELPQGWKWQRLGEISTVVRGGSPRPAGDKKFYDGEIPFLKVADLTATDDIYLHSYSYTIKQAGLTKTRYVDADTLMLTNSGATLGVPKICTFPTTFNDGIAAFLDLPSSIDKVFLYYFLKSRTGWYRTDASRGQGQPNLNTDIIKATVLGIPPLAEQHRIVAKVDQLMALCDELEAKLRQEQTASAKLMTATVQHLAVA